MSHFHDSPEREERGILGSVISGFSEVATESSHVQMELEPSLKKKVTA